MYTLNHDCPHLIAFVHGSKLSKSAYYLGNIIFVPSDYKHRLKWVYVLRLHSFLEVSRFSFLCGGFLVCKVITNLAKRYSLYISIVTLLCKVS